MREIKIIDTDEVIKYHKQGFSLLQISKKLNCSISTLQLRLKQKNIVLKEYKLIDEKLLTKMYQDKMKMSEISNFFNCSVNTIRLRLKEYNIKLNTKKVYFKPKKGQKFNRLKFICEDKSKHNIKYWKCECECGKIKNYDYYSIIKGYVKSCGCYHKDDVKNYNWTGYKCIPGNYWNEFSRTARKRNIEFDITIEYGYSLYEKQNKKCKLSNLPIEFETTNNKIKTFQASLDRIDNNIGYVDGNVQWIVKEINYMKNKISEDKFISLCKIINNFNQK